MKWGMWVGVGSARSIEPQKGIFLGCICGRPELGWVVEALLVRKRFPHDSSPIAATNSTPD